MNPQPVFPSRVIRSRRRSMALEIRPTGEVWLRIPDHVSLAEAQAFVDRHRAWIEKRLEKLAQRPPVRQLNSEEIDLLFFGDRQQ